MKKYFFVGLILLLIGLVISCDDIAKPDNPDIPDDTSVEITLDPNVEGKNSVTRTPGKDGKVYLPNGVDLWGDVGFEFNGWATTKDGSVVYEAGVAIAFKKSQTLYAVWNKSSSASIPFTITYWVNNGTDVSIPKNYEAGANPKILDCEDEDVKEIIKKEGHTFKSWNTKQDGSGTYYDINIPYDGHGDLTLYAEWIEVDPMLTLDTFGNQSRVVGCDDGAVNVTIPEYYQGRKVTIVTSKAFNEKYLLEKVSFPNTIKNIGEDAFYYCNKLDNVTLPDSLEYIGKSAFHYCEALTTIKIPNSVTTIGQYAFSQCNKLEHITIPNGITELKNYVFYKAGLKSITLPDTLKTIGERTFIYCDKLETITIPNSVTSIGKNAFHRCLRLTSVVIPGSIETLGEEVFYQCEMLKSVVIKHGVKSIGQTTFIGCNKLESIELPNSLISLGTAFGACEKLSLIRFHGLKSEWGSVEKADNWNANIIAQRVICNDGDFPIT